MGERRGQGEGKNGRMSIPKTEVLEWGVEKGEEGRGKEREGQRGRRRGREGERGEREREREREKEPGVSTSVQSGGGCEWITKGPEGEDAWQCACKG